jgi:dienelactone hydrolase
MPSIAPIDAATGWPAARARPGRARRRMAAAAAVIAAAGMAWWPMAPARAQPARSAAAPGAGAPRPSASASRAQPQSVAFTNRDGTRLHALLLRPDSGAARHGTVIALHGCNGLYDEQAPNIALALSSRHQAMADMLLAEGYAVLFPDSYRPRGSAPACSQKPGARTVTQAQRRLDALAALSWTAAQPWADRHRIAVIGWSHGANTVLAATDAARPEVNAVPDRFAAAIAFYPLCRGPLKTGYRPNTHLAIMIGALDDWTPPQPCLALGRATQSEVHVFGGSYHGFDYPSGKVQVLPQVATGSELEQGVHFGPNPDAREEAYSRVRRLLSAALR